MKCISLWEPWATLMAIGAKRIETRSWATSYRGWLAIHASKGGLSKRDLAGTIEAPDFLRALKGCELKPGHILAVVKLIDCCWTGRTTFPFVLLVHSQLDTPQERAFGDYGPNRYGWVTDQLFQLPEPIPYKAKQGLLELEADVVAEVQRQFKRDNWRFMRPPDLHSTIAPLQTTAGGTSLDPPHSTSTDPRLFNTKN